MQTKLQALLQLAISKFCTEDSLWGGCCAGDRQGQYSGMLDCFVKSFRSGGLGTFYQGFLPNFARLGSWNVVMFLTMEQARPPGPVAFQGYV